jgi:putative transposase
MNSPRKLHPYTPPQNQRLDAETYAEEGCAALITIRAYSRQPFAGNDALCDTVVTLLTEMRTEYGCWVGAYCLMPDHFHFVTGVNVPGSSILTFVDRLKGRSTNESWKYGCQGRLWQKRSHDRVLRASEALPDIYQYILDNPVRAGLVTEAEAWRWSGILDDVR